MSVHALCIYSLFHTLYRHKLRAIYIVYTSYSVGPILYMIYTI